jgi:1-acyl-sn-glycerol-3-phosphate acyltransferase
MELIKRVLFEIFRWPIVNLWYLTGWRVSQDKIDEPRLVITGAPHTSNWDYPMFLLAILHLRRQPFVTIKHTLFFPPIGFFLRLFGGMPIDRTKSHNLVEQMSNLLNSRELIWMVFSPDGTRKYQPNWKTGFYWVAVEADVPILCAAINYKTKTITLDLMFKPSGDIEADMIQIHEYQEKYAYGRYPENMNPVVLRPKEPSPDEANTVEAAS